MRPPHLLALLFVATGAFLAGRYLLPATAELPGGGPDAGSIGHDIAGADTESSRNDPSSVRSAPENALPEHAPGTPSTGARETSVTGNALRAERERATTLEREKTGLNVSVAALRAEISQLREQLQAERAKSGALGPELAIAFGGWSKNKTLRGVSWKEMGEATQEMNEALSEVAAAKREGRAQAPGVQERITRANKRMVDGLLAILPELPSQAGVNGSFSHPILIANLLAQHLENAALPLSDEQRAALVDLGSAYDAAWSELQRTKDSGALAIEAVLAELQLKDQFMQGALAALTPEQRQIVAPGGVEHRLYNPSIMLQGLTYVVSKPNEEQLRGSLQDFLAAHFSMPVEDVHPVAYALVRWIEETRQAGATIEGDSIPLIPASQALVFGHAQVRFMKEALTVLNPSDEVRTRVREATTLVFPLIAVATGTK